MAHMRSRLLMQLARQQPSSAAYSFRTQDAKPFPVLEGTLEISSAELSAARTRAEELAKNLQFQLETCRQGGGEKGIERHVKLNKKMLVRERIRRILDPGSELWELGPTAGLGLEYGDVACGGTVCGVGTIHGNKVMILANDGTVKGGTFYPITIAKQLRIQEIARRTRLPCLQIVDTGGAFLPLQSEIFLPGGRGFANQAIMSSQGIQQIALVSGLCTAGGAYAPTMSDVAIITHRIGNIYLGGPPLVKAATGEVVSGEELGGARMHCSVSGITDHFAQDEEESFQITRDVIATLNIPPTRDLDNSEPPLYNSSEDLSALASLETIDKPVLYAILARLLDGSRFFEFKKLFGGNLVCGFGNLCGQLTGILGNCGPISAADAQKGAHFIQLCDLRDIPLIFLQNSSCSTKSGPVDGITMKERGKMIHAHSIASVPRITLNMGGSVGDENYTMCGPSFSPTFYLMWPGSRLLAAEPIPPSADDAPAQPTAEGKPRPASRKPLSTFSFPMGSAAWAAARLLCDGVVEPRETRIGLATAVQVSMLNHRRSEDSRGQTRSVIRM